MPQDRKEAREFDEELFRNPSGEYRGTPFWGWNFALDKETLLEQIGYLKEMGFGGFHMHSRCGLLTPYLGEEYMEMVRACTEKAKEEGMLACLYDEDRWPSGMAGGYVTRNPALRQKYLLFTKDEELFPVAREKGESTGEPFLLACYDVRLNERGELEGYGRMEREASAEGDKWYAYVKTPQETSWYNYQTYADVMDEEAVDEFIRITYGRYREAVGDEYGKTIRTMFTDEPQMYRKENLRFALKSRSAALSWTRNLDGRFREKYGFDLVEKLPELFWNLPDGEVSYARYCYHDFTAGLFAEHFSARCARACEKDGLMLTGHMVDEPTLSPQIRTAGDVMRALAAFHIPGIDMLCDDMELGTAKQAQSIARQYKRWGVMSELYGVTNWDFDFRGYKYQGDWQAALGVTMRVPSMAWASMSGISKRDYPGVVHYQAPWYKEYSYLENHYARLAVALSRGVPIVKIGVIHPIESCWIEWGPEDQTAEARSSLEESHQRLMEWLLYNHYDFDFINEALLPDQVRGSAGMLRVGEMEYAAVIVNGCRTLRRTTLDILRRFAKSGGRLIFMGDCPQWIDAQRSRDAEELYALSTKVCQKRELFAALKGLRQIEILNADGSVNETFFSNLRKDGEFRWLFLAHGRKPRCVDVPEREDLILKVDGEACPMLYDTLSGDIRPLDHEIERGRTVIPLSLYGFDSLLIRLEPLKERMQAKTAGAHGAFKEPEMLESSGASELLQPHREGTLLKTVDFKEPVDYALEEENVCLLDMAEFSLDGGAFFEKEEIRKIDERCVEMSGLPDEFAQLWAIEAGEPHHVVLRFRIWSEIRVENAFLAFERAEKVTINGRELECRDVGYYVDKFIRKYPVGELIAGENVIEATVAINRHLTVENFYLLGDFGVRTAGCTKILCPGKKKLAFSSVANQGLAFYGGNILYRTEVDMPAKGFMRIRISSYRGALVKILLDGEEAGKVIFPPYAVMVKNVEKGRHRLEFLLYGNRYNTFAGLHNTTNDKFCSPLYWRTSGERWCYEYRLGEMGILASPVIELYGTEGMDLSNSEILSE